MAAIRDSHGDSPQKAFESILQQKLSHFSFDREIHAIAEQFRQQAIAEIKGGDNICHNKQKLISSVKVVKGAKKDEYLVVSDAEYGKELEYGTKNSQESPWFAPAFVTVAGSIDKCLHGALKRALQKARRLRDSR